ncbi:hypothetical protein P3342_002092 [Pyrenophora teres f. teres]|nr:hypothetical protein P3342_002092 [Pyrenophora teres f. teres]
MPHLLQQQQQKGISQAVSHTHTHPHIHIQKDQQTKRDNNNRHDRPSIHPCNPKPDADRSIFTYRHTVRLPLPPNHHTHTTPTHPVNPFHNHPHPKTVHQPTLPHKPRPSLSKEGA